MVSKMLDFGGYFEFEIFSKKNVEFHKNAFKLNTGRNAINYLCLVNEYKKLYIPHYLCQSVEDALRRDNICYDFYYLDEDFYPKITGVDFQEAILYPNYFGTHTKNSKKLLDNFRENMIIDNTQAFFAKHSNANVVYSARKFFGVPDGSYAYSIADKIFHLEQDYSYDRVLPLFKRLEKGANFGYVESLRVENLFSNLPVKKMSPISTLLLERIDYSFCAKKRIENFLVFHEHFAAINELKMNALPQDIPMIYPLLLKNKNLRERLIENGIYVPQWWKSVKKKVSKGTFEYYLSEYLIPLSVDHRYNKEGISRVAATIKLIIS